MIHRYLAKESETDTERDRFRRLGHAEAFRRHILQGMADLRQLHGKELILESDRVQAMILEGHDQGYYGPAERNALLLRMSQDSRSESLIRDGYTDDELMVLYGTPEQKARALARLTTGTKR